MTTARQVGKLLAPLLSRNRDLVRSEHTRSGYEICLLPIRHVLRHILIRRASMASYFSVQFHVTELFRPEPSLTDGFGWCFDQVGRSKLTHPTGGGTWRWADPTMAADFVTQIEERVLPVLRPLDTLEACVTYARQHREMAWCGDYTWRTEMDIALGDLEAARRTWAPKAHHHVPGRRVDAWYDSQRTYDRYCALGAALMADDRVELARLLHTWEAEWITNRKLTPHWQKTPFPLESGL